MYKAEVESRLRLRYGVQVGGQEMVSTVGKRWYLFNAKQFAPPPPPSLIAAI
jgi:hypothetical protein